LRVLDGSVCFHFFPLRALPRRPIRRRSLRRPPLPPPSSLPRPPPRFSSIRYVCCVASGTLEARVGSLACFRKFFVLLLQGFRGEEQREAPAAGQGALFSSFPLPPRLPHTRVLPSDRGSVGVRCPSRGREAKKRGRKAKEAAVFFFVSCLASSTLELSDSSTTTTAR